MRLTRLEIFGFKSFVERFVLNFDRNKIGIVGPNGCGKSNIVDALRWVLGETHAKHLRGAILEDLIFNGSETRRPLGMAEVIITIRPNSGWTDNLGLDEVEKLSQESKAAAERMENLIQAQTIDAKPAEDNASTPETNGMLANEGEGTGGQGTTVEVAPESLSPEELLAAVPSAAEVTAPEQAVEQTVLPQVIREIPGLLNASEIQFTRRLYRSGESEYFINRVPCRLRDMIDVYRVIGLGARGLSIVQQGEIGQFISRKPVERRELLEEAAGISGFRNRMEVAQKKLEKTSENMDRLRDIMEEVEKQVRVLKRQATRARERNELKASILREDICLFRGKRVRLLLNQGQNTKSLNEFNERLIGAQTAALHAESRQGELQAELEEHETLIADHRRNRDLLQSAFERERSRLQSLEVQKAKTQTELGSFGRERDQIHFRQEQFSEETRKIEARRDELTRQIEESEARRAEAEAALKTLQQDETRKQALEVDLSLAKNAVPETLRLEIAELEQKVGRVLGVESELKELEKQTDSKRRELDGSRKQLHGVELQLSSVESEIRSLNKQLEALAEQVSKATGENSQSQDDSVKRVLLAGLRVPEKAQRAVSAILGERAHYLVSEDSVQSAKGFADRMKNGKQNSGRIGVIRQGVASGVGTSQKANILDSDRAVAFSVTRLQDHLNIDEDLSGVVETFLGQFLFVETLQEAINLVESRLSANLGLETWVVTSSGEVFTPWGWYTTEGKGASFSFTRRIEEMDGKRKELQTEQNSIREIVSALEQETAEILKSRESLVAERRELSENDRRLSGLHRQVLDIERHERDRLLAQSRLKQEQFLREERDAQDRLRSSVTAVARLQQETEFCGNRIHQIGQDEERCQHMLTQLEAREERLNEEIHRLGEEIEKGMNLDGNMTLSEFHARCEYLDKELKSLASKREPVRLALSEISADVAENRRAAQKVEDEIRKLSVQEERFRIELEMLSEEICRLHPENEQISALVVEEVKSPLLTVEDAVTELSRLLVSGEGVPEDEVQDLLKSGLEKFIQAVQESSQKLRKRLEREGEVDPQSIELYEQENTRLLSMQEQYADLEEARKILDTTIRRLKEISRQRFLETFTAVNRKFQELIPRLFGGGAGHLELLNPDDPLQSGVELMVRPPGKRLGSMELMSGGEKALVAIGVLISMFLHRPSPICVLDEVDAPLDEANLERYLSLISEISQKVQFLVITHNKRTMTEADRLIGITMQEKGVSTALAVSLEDVEVNENSLVIQGGKNSGVIETAPLQ